MSDKRHVYVSLSIDVLLSHEEYSGGDPQCTAATDGNARHALTVLSAWAKQRPEGAWGVH